MTQVINPENLQRSRRDIEAHLVAKAWKDESFKQQLLSNPKAIILQEFGVELPEQLNIQVMEENANTLFITLPALSDLSETELSDHELEAVAGGFTPLAASIAFGGGGIIGFTIATETGW